VAQNGDTPLHIADAVYYGVTMVETLLAAKADVNAKNEVRGEDDLEGEGGAAWGFCVTVVVFSFDPEAVERPTPGTIDSTVSPNP